MVKISNLCVQANGKDILKSINLEFKRGEVHAIMGPNGSGKSTLLKVLSGSEEYEILTGKVLFEKDFEEVDLLSLSIEDRAREGIFLGFQYPVEIPGISNRTFLRASFNAICKHQGVDEMSVEEFNELLDENLRNLKIPSSMLDRSVNVDFSGGEKKRNEILQMAILKPLLALLDETDSGLDIDSMKTVAEGINRLKNENNSFVLVTHYHRLLNYVNPNFVHILFEGSIVKTGDASLATEIEEKGYDWLVK